MALEKEIQHLREENKNLKVEANTKIYDCNKEIDNTRIRYEADRDELLNVKNILIIYYFLECKSFERYYKATRKRKK